MIRKAWLLHPAFWVEVFILSNLAFLAVDIYFAHSVNQFGHATEWIPFGFSIIATVLLVPFFPRTADDLTEGRSRFVGCLVGVASIGVGIGGFILHLESQFFAQLTIVSLVYTAPFIAPLSYAGLGFLLLLNRMESIDSRAWGYWVLFLAGGGIFGNFVLTLADHAQNGFFHTTEWIPVCASAIMLGFLIVILFRFPNRAFLLTAGCVALIHAGVGVLGFAYHGLANLEGPSSSLWDNTVYGAPVFAPLLLTNLSLLIGIGLWKLYQQGSCL
jgi:hypothetical protein